MVGKNDEKEKGLPPPEDTGGFNIVDIRIPIGKKVCPAMMQFTIKAGGFNTPQMVVFAVNCLGIQCGRYNECNNIQGKVDG